MNKHPPIADALQAFAWFQLLEAGRRRLRLHTLFLCLAPLLPLGALGALAVGFLANFYPAAAWVLLASCLVLLAASLAWGLTHALHASTHANAARLLASHLPSLHLDFLAAWELALSNQNPTLTRAFWENLETRLQQLPHLTPPKQNLPKKYLLALAASLALAAALAFSFNSAWKSGLQKMQGSHGALLSPSAEPIAGEFVLRYRFPEYTGLPPLTVHNSNGEVSALQGTTVEWEAKADRKIKHAQLRFGQNTLPLKVSEKRKLHGSWVASASGSYQIEFLEKGKVVAQSPPIPIHLSLDYPPEVRLLSPENNALLSPEENNVLLRFEASDDYGLSALELRYAVDNQAVETLPLPLSKTRRVQSEFLWELALLPGQTVHYSLVAKDNDANAGNKEGLSQTQTLQKFSPAMHQKKAMDKTQQAWKQLLSHAANRLESGEMPSRASKPSPLGSGLDEEALHVATQLEQTSKDILQDEQAPQALAAAFANAAQTLRRMADNTAKARQKNNADALSRAVSAEVSSAENHLLYLEDLLNQFRVEAAAEFGSLLKSQLAELKALLSQHQLATEPEQKAALLAQIQKRKASIFELLQRISEMSKTEEADEAAVDWSATFEEEAQNAMASLEAALDSGHMDEALRQTDTLLSQLDKAPQAQTSQNTQTHAELMEEFEDFRKALESVLTDQEALLKKTQALHEKQHEKAAKALAQKTQAARPELNAHLEELRSKLKNLNLERMTAHEQNLREEALKNVEMMKSSLSSDDASLASDIVKELVQKTDELAAASKRQEDLDRALGNSPEERQRSKETREASLEGAEKARDFEERLRSLFGHKSGLKTEADTTSFAEPLKEQEALGERTRKVQRQMDALSEKAPLFSEEAKEQMEAVARHMEKAAARLRLNNIQEGQSEQNQATQSLQALQQQLQAGGTAKASLPMPSSSGKFGQGTAQSPQRLALPQNIPAAQPHLRKELLETMRQGVPEGYAVPVRRYYEELVK